MKYIIGLCFLVVCVGVMTTSFLGRSDEQCQTCKTKRNQCANSCGRYDQSCKDTCHEQYNCSEECGN
jgi:hypothetical protein